MTTAVTLLLVGAVLTFPQIALWRVPPVTPLERLAFTLLGLAADGGQAVLTVGALVLGLVLVGRLTGVLPAVRRDRALLGWGLGIVLVATVANPVLVQVLVGPGGIATGWRMGVLQVLMTAVAMARVVGCLLLAAWLVAPARSGLTRHTPDLPVHGGPAT